METDFSVLLHKGKGSLMRRKPAFRLLCSAALIAALTIGAGATPGFAETKPEEKTVTFDPGKVNTFSGAFLAARTADVDQDYATAISLYKRRWNTIPPIPKFANG